MGCEDCKWIQENGEVYWLRVEEATVGIIACEKHFGKIREKILEDD